MSTEFVNTPWAMQAVKCVNDALAGWNRTRPEEEHMFITWGDPEPAAEDVGESEPLEEEMQFGLLTYDGYDYEFRITAPYEGEPLRLRVSLVLERSVRLLASPREIFNVLCSLMENCTMSLFRRNDTDKIDIFSVETFLCADGLSGNMLLYALNSLRTSVDGIHDQLVSDNGPDFWEGDDHPSDEVN